jgi:hypothetical protein
MRNPVPNLVSILATMTASAVAAQEPPPILQITIERIKLGGLAEYGVIEERLAEVCDRLGCPNSYLALLSVDEPKEVWWFVVYPSHADIDRVGHAYEQNQPLLKAMRELTALKKDITDEPIAYFTSYRADLSGDSAWRVGSEEFTVIATAPDRSGGAVFEAPDGKLFEIVTEAKRADANSAAAKLGSTARVFEVRPTWSKPDGAWTAANPELWSERASRPSSR